MLGRPVLRGLLSAGDGEPLSAGPRCEGAGGSCRAACAAACPRGVLRFSGERPQAEEGCDGCGLCAAACPRQALRVRSVERAWEPGSAVVSCREAGSPPSSAGPCLGALSPERAVLLAARAGGILWLEAGTCHCCPLGPVSEGGLRRLRLLEKALGEAAGRPVLRWGRPPSEGSPRRGLDRRGFLRCFGGGDPRSPIPSGPVRRRPLREALAVLLEGKEPTPPLVAFLEALRAPRVVADLCTLCGACAVSCPEGALGLEARGSHLALRLFKDACTGCGRCAEACPTGILVLAACPGGAEEEVLAEGEASLCVECGRILRRNPSGASRCPACSLGARRRAASPFAGYPRREARHPA
ncbi:MAG: 4Fe-4S binding protein [Acidobacteriota bacterium]